MTYISANRFWTITATLVLLLCLVFGMLIGGRSGRTGCAPSLGPAEENRIHHPNGFSVVAPANWNVTVHASTGALVFRSDAYPARTPHAVFVAWRLPSPPDIKGIATHIQFQGKDAIRIVEEVPAATFEDDPRSSYYLYFQRDGIWYALQYTCHGRLSELPPIMEAYFDTFQVDQRRAPEEGPTQAEQIESTPERQQ